MPGDESGGLSLQGSSHLRYMFPSVDPESNRPVTIKPNGGVTKAERLPQLGLTGEASNSIVTLLGGSKGVGLQTNPQRRAESSRPARLEPMRNSWPASKVETEPDQKALAISANLNSPSYFHYDVIVNWDKDPNLDTSPFSPAVQEYTRLYYCNQQSAVMGNKKKLRPMTERPGMGTSRMERRMQTQLSGGAGNHGAGSVELGGGTFNLTETDVPGFRGEDDLLETKVPLHLWYQYASHALSEMDLHKLRDWATKLRPRSIQDMKPMLILCQALLRDLLSGKITDMEHEMESLLKRHAEEKETLINHYEAKCDVMRKEMQRVHGELSQLRKDSSASAFIHQVKGKAQGLLATKEETFRAREMKTEAEDVINSARTEVSEAKDENDALQQELMALKSRVMVSDAACKVQEDKNRELHEQISDMRKWYKDNLERVEQKVDLHLLASKKDNVKGAQEPSEDGFILAARRASYVSKSINRFKDSIKMARTEADMIEENNIVNPQVLDTLQEAETEEELYEAAADLIADAGGENLGIMLDEDDNLVFFGSIPMPDAAEHSSAPDAAEAPAQALDPTLQGLSRIEDLLKGLNQSLADRNEATREKMKKALSKKKVLVTAGKNRKWVGIPLMNKDGAAILQTAFSATEGQKREAEKVALEKAKTAKEMELAAAAAQAELDGGPSAEDPEKQEELMRQKREAIKESRMANSKTKGRSLKKKRTTRYFADPNDPQGITLSSEESSSESDSESSEVDEDEEFVRDWVAEIFDRVLVSCGEVASQVTKRQTTKTADIMRRQERQETREKKAQEKAVRKAEKKAAKAEAVAAKASETPQDPENPTEAAGGAAQNQQEAALAGEDADEQSEGKPARTRVRNSKNDGAHQESSASGQDHDGPVEVPVVADIDFSALRSQVAAPGGSIDSPAPVDGTEASAGVGEGTEAPGENAPDAGQQGGEAGDGDEVPEEGKAAPGKKVSKHQAAKRQESQLAFFHNNQNVSVGEEGQQVVVDSDGNVVNPDENGLMTVVGDDGKKQTLMYDVDGNLVPALVDATGDPVLNESGKPMSAWVLDSEGRVAYTADDKTINVALQGGKPVALVSGKDGKPSFQALETSDAGGLPGPRLPPEVQEVGASVRQVLTSDGSQSFAIKTTRTINGREVEVDVVIAEDGTETVIMQDADGNSVALVVDESGDVVVGDDGKPVTREVPEAAKIAIAQDQQGASSGEAVDSGIAPSDSGAPAKIETREIEGVDGPVEVVVLDDGQQIAVIKDEDGNEVSVLLDADGKIVTGEDGKPVVTTLPPEIEQQRMSNAADGITKKLSAEDRRASAISKASRASTASGGPKVTHQVYHTKEGVELKIAVDDDGNPIIVNGMPVAIIEEDGRQVLVDSTGAAVIVNEHNELVIDEGTGQAKTVDRTLVSATAIRDIDNDVVYKAGLTSDGLGIDSKQRRALDLSDLDSTKALPVDYEESIRAWVTEHGREALMDSEGRALNVVELEDGRQILMDADNNPIINPVTGRPIEISSGRSSTGHVKTLEQVEAESREASARLNKLRPEEVEHLVKRRASLLPGASGAKEGDAEEQAPDGDAAAAAHAEDAAGGSEGNNAGPDAGEGTAAPSGNDDSISQIDEGQAGTGGDSDPSAALQPEEETESAEPEPVMNSMLVVDDTGRSFMEDANGNHIRVILDAEGKAVIADENGQALLDSNGQPIAVPVAEDGAVDLTLLSADLRDVVQEKGHTLEDSEPFPPDVKADLDALEMERVKQMTSLNGFIQWCRDRVANKKANDNEFLDELEEVISGYRASHAARAWKGKNTYKRHMSIRVEERVDQLKTIRATILKELDKTKTLQQLQELKNYRDPSRSVITIINAILLIIQEESVEEFVEPAINQCRLSANPNAIKSLWKIMKPVVIDVNFIHRLNKCDTTGDDDSTLAHCDAASFTLMQVTPQEAKRSSKVVALLRHWVELQLLIHQQALEYRRTNEVPKGTHIQIGRK